ncbi:putative CRAL-TRIO lipid binding domain, GOLD domain, CRAL/TRIO domain superfamily [Plasmopara halstedii]
MMGKVEEEACADCSGDLLKIEDNVDVIEETFEELEAEEKERAANKKIVDALADEEQQRRLKEEKDQENDVAITRQINSGTLIRAAEEEREQCLREHQIANIQNEIVRRRSQAESTKDPEEERKQLLIEEENVQQQRPRERLLSQELVMQLKEKERLCHSSLPEHREDGFSNDCHTPLKFNFEVNSGEYDQKGMLDGFSEIPVVQASASKVLVDGNSEWRCFIASENAQVEQSQLHALRLSLVEELKAERHAKYLELVGDVRLLRFLRGHKMNVSVAATKYREMMIARQKLNLDDIRDDIVKNNLVIEDFPHFQKIIQHLPFLDTYDMLSTPDGHTFYYEMTGYADFQKLLTNVTEDEWQSFFLYSMEYRALKLDQLSRQHERLVQTILVCDLTGFSITRFNPKMFKRLQPIVSIATKCYPESVHKLFILHAPWIFEKIWDVIQSMLQETQLHKLYMKGNSHERLLELAGGRDNLPKLLGGRCTTHTIPQTGYLGRDAFLMLCEDGATQADIKSSSTLQLPFRVSANNTLCWEFVVKDRDIVFAVKFRTQGIGGAEECDKVAPERISSGALIADSYTAFEDGTVVLLWDNSFSWTREKTIAYKAKVVKSTHDFSSLNSNIT